MKISWRADRKIEAYQQELIKTHFAEVDNMYRKMRGWRHDYRNHIQVLKAYADKGDLQAISRIWRPSFTPWTRCLRPETP